MHEASLIDLKVALIDLTEAMKSPATGELVKSMERLDALVARCGQHFDPRLRHFLERRSYAKALAFLSGQIPKAPAGGCSSSGNHA